MATVKTSIKDGFRHFQCDDEESCLRLSFLIKDAGYGFKMSSNWVKKHTEFKIIAAEKDPMEDPKVIKGAKALRINLQEAKGKRASASQIINSLEQRIDRLERQSSKRNASMGRQAGRRYDDDQWIFFIHEETDLEDDREGSREAGRLRDKFEECIENLCDKHDLSICYDDGVSTVAFKAFASLAGHGTGLWDHDHPEADTLENLVQRDRKCGDLAQQIEDLPYDLGLA